MRQLLACCCVLLLSARAVAAEREHRIALHDGRLQVHDLNSALCAELRLPSCPVRHQIDLNSTAGPEFLLAVNACLGDGCFLSRSATGLVLTVDPARLPGRCEGLRRLTRVFTAEMCPHATAAQARNWGLLVPNEFDPGRPLVVLIHGLDADRSECRTLGELLRQAGHQVAYFGYPGNQPIADSSALLARCLRLFRQRYPCTSIDLVGHSMGGLIARDYVEGPDYGGGVDRLIQIAPPNHGSRWARARCLLSIEQNYRLRRDDPDWRWSWLITEGMGEAGSDLLPGSDFLKRLNSRPRRPGVRYTILAGNKGPVQRTEAAWIDSISCLVPARARGWWGLGHCYAALHRAAGHFRNETCDDDGPVSLDSARLQDVADFVVCPGDHLSLFLQVDGHPPEAWRLIADRLTIRPPAGS